VTAVQVLAMGQGLVAADITAVARLAAQVASALVQEGTRWPALAAACLAARGIAGDLDQRDWALRLSLPAAVVEAAEAGDLPPNQVPPALMDAADQAWSAWRTWPARGHAPPPVGVHGPRRPCSETPASG
jgi:hypothetical protein